MEYLDNIGKRAQTAKPDLQHLKSEEKNQNHSYNVLISYLL